MARLQGRTCLITGSTGIAAASAELFVAEGARVFFTSRTEQKCAELHARLVAAGGRAAYVTADLSDERQVASAVQTCVATYGRIDGLFNVAGISGRRYGDGPAHEAEPAGWDATLDGNARSMFLVCAEVIRRMLDQEPDTDGVRGAVLNMASVLAFSPSPGLFATHAYAASKGAIVAMSTAMAAYYAPFRIRVNVVAPGLVATPMSQRAQADEATASYLRRKQPLVGGVIDAREVAYSALYLLSGESRAVTGALLTIDGGWSVTETD
jgi:NAD(P)-dependent dehydrogenase (short-subunit alcohol dehydrogenase family)